MVLLLLKSIYLFLLLLDFGFAQYLRSDSEAQTIRGSPLYMVRESCEKGIEHLVIISQSVSQSVSQFSQSASCQQIGQSDICYQCDNHQQRHCPPILVASQKKTVLVNCIHKANTGNLVCLR